MYSDTDISVTFACSETIWVDPVKCWRSVSVRRFSPALWDMYTCVNNTRSSEWIDRRSDKSKHAMVEPSALGTCAFV